MALFSLKRVPYSYRSRVLISLSTEPVMHFQCDVRSVLTFLAPEHCHCPLDGNRVATNLENLENSGISLNVENSWNFQGILFK